MKKLLSLILIAAMLFSLCACSIVDLVEEDEDDEKEEQVEEKSEKPIKLNAYEVTLEVGETFQMIGKVSGAKTLKWKSSNESVVLVNSHGVVTAAAPGAANITCYASGASDAVCTVTVTGASAPTVNAPVIPPATEPTDPPVAAPTVPVAPPASTSGFIFPHSSTAYLTESEVYQKLSTMTGYSPAQDYAQDAINEIYARNGYIFSNSKLADYYRSQPWYYPNENFSIENFNEYEKANIQLLQTFF